MALTDNLDKAIKDIEVKFKGGLSNTSTNKFNDLSIVVAEITGLPEDDIYITSVYARSSNTWNRLSQGKPLSRHYTLSVCIASPDGVNGVLAPLGSFIGDGNVHYDNIAVVAQDTDSVWRIKAIATNAKDDTSIKCQDQFPDAFIKLVNPVQNPVEEVVKRSINPDEATTPSPVSVANWGGFPAQLITYGAPGTGKSWSVKQETQGRSCIRTTFHPDSDYSTFIGAYKPSMEEDDYDTIVTTGEKAASGTIVKKDGLVRQKRIVYKFVAQAFLEAYVEAWRKCAAFLSAKDDEARGNAVQFLVIEEINRGNCAQIFGDIFQLLDREDDGYSSYAIKADNDLRQYLAGAFGGDAALDLSGVNLADHDVTPDEIRNGVKMLLPPNLFIRATMNTSDQSLFPIDSAFKRRWDWKYMPITDEKKGWKIRVETPVSGGTASGASGDDAAATITPTGGESAVAPANDSGEGTAATGTAGVSGSTVTEYDWWKFLDTINGLISGATKSEDKQLGYYFARPDKGGTAISAAKFVNKVLFYLYNDVFKDYDLPKGFTKPDGKDKFAFKDFFLADGKPNEVAVRDLLTGLLGTDA